LVFQCPALLDSINATDSVTFPPRDHRNPRVKDTHEKALMKLSILGLEKTENRFPS